MLNAIAEIILAGVTEIEPNEFGGFFLSQYLDKGLPYGYFHIKDRNSDYINQYENLQIGATVDIVLKNTQDDEDTLTFPTFYLLKVEDDFSTDPSKFAGTIRVWFGHPWFLFKDSNNHAYNPMNHSKLIKKVLENEDRGLKFEINKDCFAESDDSGKYSRYKVCETDFDFIRNKIIPFTTIDQLPPLFFCSLLKKKEETKYKFGFNLSNSSVLYKQNPKIIITPTQEALIEGTNIKDVEKICNKNNLDPDSDIFYLRTLKIKIMYEENIKNIYPRIYGDDLRKNKSFKLGNKLKNKLAEKSGSSFGNLLPIDTMYMTKLQGTSVNLIKNRILIDALSLILSTGKDLDNMFNLIVELVFCGDKVTIGNTIEIFAPLMMEDEKQKESWIKGKWLVTGIESYTNNESEDPYQLMSKLYLSRPSFIGESNRTTLTMKDMLYEVD
jgi:hypothetical protein